MKKDYLITKVSDQKDKKYTYCKELELDDCNIPTEEEVHNLMSLEKNKSVVLITGEEKITILSFKAESKLIRNFKKEYEENWKDEKIKNFSCFAKKSTIIDIIKLKKLIDLKNIALMSSKNKEIESESDFIVNIRSRK